MKKRVRITIKDIANALNISPSTVSFVLNNRHKELRIADALADKVRQKARELGYVPNITARRLLSQRWEEV